jgi:hypothetical protein
MPELPQYVEGVDQGGAGVMYRITIQSYDDSEPPSPLTNDTSRTSFSISDAIAECLLSHFYGDRSFVVETLANVLGQVESKLAEVEPDERLLKQHEKHASSLFSSAGDFRQYLQQEEGTAHLVVAHKQ